MIIVIEPPCLNCGAKITVIFAPATRPQQGVDDADRLVDRHPQRSCRTLRRNQIHRRNYAPAFHEFIHRAEMHWAIADAIFDGVVPDAGLTLAEGRQPRLDATIMSTCVPRSVSRCPASLLGIQGHSAAACGFHLHKNPAPMSRERQKGRGRIQTRSVPIQ
jgi:hypothetical protein